MMMMMMMPCVGKIITWYNSKIVIISTKNIQRMFAFFACKFNSLTQKQRAKK